MNPMRRALFAGTMLLTLASAACTGPPIRLNADDRKGPAPKPPSDEEVADRVADVLKRHNEERKKEKLHSLEVNPRLKKAAERHARDMAARRVMSHKGGDGTTPMDRIKDAGYDYRRGGENVAYGRFTPERLMAGWMGSPPHKKNILGSFSQIGIACATAEDGMTYWCVTFGLPMRD
jgi:uncharacterized protein YkwD